MSDVNILAEKICKAAELEYDRNTKLARDSFLRALRVVGHQVSVEVEGKSIPIERVVNRLIESAKKAQLEDIHSQAIQNFHQKYSQIAEFMSQED